MGKNKILISAVFLFSLIACGNHVSDNGNNELGLSSFDGNPSSSSNFNLPATINFFNESSFKVDIYKNLNPEHFDPTVLVCSVNPGETKKVTLYASFDNKIGDTFYMRYKVLLANAFETGTNDIYVDAERNLSNINFVVESGKSYTKTIPQPQLGELRFVNGYMKIQNTGTTQIRIEKGVEVLEKLDDKTIHLLPGNFGYYDIYIHPLDETLTINQLKAFSSDYVNFPAFVMERGKLYSFEVSNTAVTSPKITTINPMAGQ